MIKTAVIGCGNIGAQIVEFIDKKYFNILNLSFLVDLNEEAILNLQKKLANNQPKLAELKKAAEEADLIIEAANPKIAQEILNLNIDKPNKKIIFMSTGGLINLTKEIDSLKYAKIYFPSGAISGLDAIKAVAGQIEELSLTTAKPPKGLNTAPYILENKIILSEIKPQVIFEGSLAEAVKGFPTNINVGATLFLATRFNNLKIKIISDPAAANNTHEIFTKGRFGEIKTITQNRPSVNPKTSQLAIDSALDLVDTIVSNL